MDWNPKQKINGISIQVCLNGYSFKVSDGLAARESGWLGADSVFTAPELQRRYPRVEVSLLTPKVALVPSSFFDESSMRQCLADTVILLRYFEASGRVRRAISVIKKRTGPHEDTIREYQIDSRGLTVGRALEGFQGVLRGVPVYVGQSESLLEERG